MAKGLRSIGPVRGTLEAVSHLEAGRGAIPGVREHADSEPDEIGRAEVSHDGESGGRGGKQRHETL
jgi:hypothetical protein